MSANTPFMQIRETETIMPDIPQNNELRNIASSTSQLPSQTDFDAVIGLIEAARTRAIAAVNTSLIDLYWSIGEYIGRKIAQDGWGKGVVESLSEAIQRRYPGVTGYSAANLWRMRQFYEIYHDQPKLATLLRELSWSHNLLILSRCKREEEREFYLQPEYLGKLEFYLESLDRDVKKPHEQPSIGLLLCATKDYEVVEYALSRTVSPALVAEYETKLPDKKLLQAKLHEFFQIAESQIDKG
jgi:predicted nuclease of restriction endonuclease-like (RecB) superfamily